MKNPIYSAKFIHADEKWAPVCPYFKKSISLKGEVASARLHISALGIYEARINGERVGCDLMAPGWTNYKKRLQYFSYDVTDMLSEENELIVGVGNGWYASRGGFSHTKEGMYGTHPALICALEINYEDGSREVTVSDESWDVARSETTFSGIYDGETYDATVTPVFNEKASVFDYPIENLIPLEGCPTRQTEELSVKEIIYTPSGECVLDFGQNMTGVVEFVIENAEGGETVTLDCAEVLDKDGNFYNANYRTAKSRITYTAKAGWQVYKPRYTFFGFRYIRLSGWCEKVKRENFRALVMHSDMKRTGFFKCGHAKINKLYSNVIWGQRDNFLDIPTDCPQRDERLGWTGDAQVFARTASINYDTEKFYTKWLRDMASEQFDDGGIPHVIPDALRTEGTRNSAAWGDAACIIPWEVYTAYGNERLLREHLPMMKKWLGYMYSRPGKRYLNQGGRHFGDWLAMDDPESKSGATDRDLIASAYYYLCATLVAKACDALGLKSEKHKNMSEKIRVAYRKEFIKRDRLTSDTQTAHAITIRFGLVDDLPQLKEKLGKRLAELVEQNGDRLTTGFVGTPYLLDALTETGRADKAYELLCQEAFPSWLFSVNRGATTVWEHWDSMNEEGEMWSTEMNSFNHYAYGSVAAWLYGTVLGIKPTSPGYKTFELAPVPSKRLCHASASIETRSGAITSEWVYEDDGIRYAFTVPEGTTAELRLVDGSRETLGGGSYVRWTKA